VLSNALAAVLHDGSKFCLLFSQRVFSVKLIGVTYQRPRAKGICGLNTSLGQKRPQGRSILKTRSRQQQTAFARSTAALSIQIAQAMRQ